MIYTIEEDGDGFYIVKHNGVEISKQKNLFQATKKLMAYQKGRN